MKLGLRSQILLSLGLLLGLAFVPLYFAISTYTNVAIQRTSGEGAHALAKATAHSLAHGGDWIYLEDDHAANRPRELRALLVRDAAGNTLHAWGESSDQTKLKGALKNHSDPGSFTTALDDGSVVASARGPRTASALVYPRVIDAGPLNRLLALYMGLIALALLVGVYFTVTVWIIRPLGQVSAAAQRVASASHRLELPVARSRELTAMTESLQAMTDKLARDETALRRKVEELEQARAQLEAAQTHLVRSERLASVGQLAAGLAHEIGNPIAAMQGMQDLILDGALDAEQQLDFTRRMRSETERISRIIRDLLDFARPGSSSGPTEPANVEAAINETVTLVSPQPSLRDVQLAVDVFAELPPVALDHGQLTQVLLNLVLNAAAACDDGGVIRITARPADDGVELVVEDTGKGVPAELADKIFEPFVSSKEVGEGSGLGLSVCRGLIEASGGSIALDRDYDAGARFILQLPPSSSSSSSTPQTSTNQVATTRA